MEQNLEEIIDQSYTKKKEGMSFSQLRKELGQKGYDQETITIIIKEVDNLVIKDDMNVPPKIKSRELKIIGFCVMIVGGLITLASYVKLIDISGHSILAWGPIIGGYLMILTSRRMKKQEDRIK